MYFNETKILQGILRKMNDKELANFICTSEAAIEHEKNNKAKTELIKHYELAKCEQDTRLKN